MVTNLSLLVAAVLALFGVFIIALGYAQWSTRGMEMYRAKE